MVKAIGITGKFYFNLDGNVGVNSQNNRDDVQLVQMGYFAFSQQVASPELKEIFGKVEPGTIYHGQEDDPLTRAIRAHERNNGGPQDGRVSKLLNEAHAIYAPKQRHLILPLCEGIGKLMPDIYPRIDRHPKCPALLAEQVSLICNMKKDVFVP